MVWLVLDPSSYPINAFGSKDAAEQWLVSYHGHSNHRCRVMGIEVHR